MFKTFATNVVVSKGREGAAALKFSENGEFVRFRIGQKVYDSRVEGNYRWLNISVKAFGNVCERIQKMKLKEGSFVNLTARLDEEKWTDQETKKKKASMSSLWRILSMPMSGNPVRARIPDRIRRRASTSRQHLQERLRQIRGRHQQQIRLQHSRHRNHRQQIQWNQMDLWDLKLLVATTCFKTSMAQQSNTGVENRT